MNTKSQATELSKNNDQLETRRNFMKKFGKLAVVTPVAVTALMTPKTSMAMTSEGWPDSPI